MMLINAFMKMSVLPYLKGYKQMKENKILKLILGITILLILLDQMSKVVIQYYYNEPIGNDIIGITLIENTGMAFGFNSGNSKNIVLTLLILFIIVNFIRNQKDRIDKKTAIAISLILAGGVSNLIDRIARGGILDFIKIKHFAIFNIADCYIVIGWILLVIFLIKYNQEMVGKKDCEKP